MNIISKLSEKISSDDKALLVSNICKVKGVVISGYSDTSFKVKAGAAERKMSYNYFFSNPDKSIKYIKSIKKQRNTK